MRSEKLFLVLTRPKSQRAKALALELCNILIGYMGAELMVSWYMAHVEKKILECKVYEIQNMRIK